MQEFSPSAPNQSPPQIPYQIEGLRVEAYTATHMAEREAVLAEGAIGSGVQEIFRRGTFGGREVGFEDVARNADEIMQGRERLAEVASRNPHTADTLVRRRVGGFHGSSSVAFAGMLEDGSLTSARELFTSGGIVTTGEHIANPTGQPNISFSGFASLETAINYAGPTRPRITVAEAVSQVRQRVHESQTLFPGDQPGSKQYGLMRRMAAHSERQIGEVTRNPHGLVAQMMQEQFPVLMGVDREFVRSSVPAGKHGVTKGESSMAEFRPDPQRIPLNKLPVIAVPFEKIALVKGLLKKYGYGGNDVVAIEDLMPDAYLRHYPTDRATQVKHTQELSAAASAEQAQRTFARTRSVARRAIAAVRRKVVQSRAQPEAFNRQTWSEIDKAWMEARGTNKQVLELAMMAKARGEQSSHFSGTSGDTKVWGTRLANTAINMRQHEGQMPVLDVPQLRMNHSAWDIRTIDAHATRKADGEMGSTIRLECQRIASSGMKELITYTVQYGNDGQIAKAMATRGHMSMDMKVEASNITDVLRAVTDNMASPDTQNLVAA